MESPKKSSQNLVITDHEHSFDIYSNHTGIMTTGFDLKMIFGVVKNATDTDLNILQYGSVTLSPQHAKLFVRHLSKAIEDYEKRFGEVPIIDGSDNLKKS